MTDFLSLLRLSLSCAQACSWCSVQMLAELELPGMHWQSGIDDLLVMSGVIDCTYELREFRQQKLLE